MADAVPAILHARCAFVGAARSSVAYCKANSIDWGATQAATNGLFLAHIVVEGRCFDFASLDDENAVEAAVVEAIGEDGETVEDIVAWPTDHPERPVSMLGAAAILGSAWAANPASYFMGEPLQMFRFPLLWLQGHCQGVAVLDIERAARWRIDLDAEVMPRGFAGELHRATLSVAGLDKIVVLKREVAAT